MDENLAVKDNKPQKNYLLNIPNYIVPWILIAFSAMFTSNSFKFLLYFFKYGDFIDNKIKATGRPIFWIIIITILTIGISMLSRFLKKAFNESKQDISKNIIKNSSVAYKFSLVIIILNAIILSLFLFIYSGFDGSYVSSADGNDAAKRISIHESGHCVVNELEFPGTTTRVRLFNSKDYNNVLHYLGNEYVSNIPAGVHQSSDNFFLYKEDQMKRIKVCYAGLISERLLSNNKEAAQGSNSDLKNIKDIVISLVNNGIASNEYSVPWELMTIEQQNKLYTDITKPLYDETVAIIQDNSDKVVKLSNELFLKRSLSGSEARKIITNKK